MRFVPHKLSKYEIRYVSLRKYINLVFIAHLLMLLGWVILGWSLKGDPLHRWQEALVTCSGTAIVFVAWGWFTSKTEEEINSRQSRESPRSDEEILLNIIPLSPCAFRCKKCGLVISTTLEYLTDPDKLCSTLNEPHIASGYYFLADGSHSDHLKRQFILNLEDVVNMKNHPDLNRRVGCCGPAGYDGPNVVCNNGHEVGTERSDCCMPHAIYLDARNVEMTATN